MGMIVNPDDFGGLVSDSLTTTSRLIAEKFGKRHADVIRAIRNLECSAEFAERNFAPVEFIEEFQFKSEKRIEYRVSRDGFTFLAMGFTGKEAATWKEKFIAAFNAMEARLQAVRKSVTLDLNDPSQLVPLLASYAERTQVAEAQVLELTPKAEALDQIEAMSGSLSIRPAAKVLGIPEHKLKTWLQVNRWAFRQSGKGPLQAYTEKKNVGYLDHKHGQYTKSDGEIGISITLMITPKGLTRLAKVFSKGGEE
ncbi:MULTISPECIES: Rha family transcriptional regulator [unclassified Sulfitobacter]|uniref:Rha family transcriptional regulator n=1 Tax=unclassified Sulfitobacter TaxID=196795 RepID=UPI003744E0F2